AFELHGELAWHAPVDRLNPATHTAVAGAAGTGRVGGLDRTELENALGIAASRITLGIGDGTFGPIATGNAAAQGVYAYLLADGGVSGPDGLAAPNGWHDLVGPFDIDLDPGCERVLDAGVLPYDSHLYGQPTIEAAIDLATEVALDPADIESVTVETVEKAVGEIDSERVAAALVDRALSIHQGNRADLQPIADATTVSAIEGTREHSDIESLPTRVVVETYDGDVYEEMTEGFEGHPATPASWGTVEEKFHALAGDTYDRDRREEIVETVRGFEAESPTELARLLD
ncbi:MAG: MmgE/PrpD family protein, partial [Natronomonas sp.]